MGLGRTWRGYAGVGAAIACLTIAAIGGYFWLGPSDQEDEAELIRQLRKGKGRVAVLGDPGPGTSTHNVRLLEIKTGRIVPLTNDPSLPVSGGTILTFGPGTVAAGYLALVERGAAGGRPLHDAVLVRFSDMKRFVLAQRLAGLDRPLMRADETIRAVTWDEHGQGWETVFDLAGKKVASRRPTAAAPPAPPGSEPEPEVKPMPSKMFAPAIY